MVVGCPKCKAKLKIPDEKIKPEGTKFKCPKCQATLLVKMPAKKAASPPLPPEPKAPPKSFASASDEPSYIKKGLPVGMEPWPDMPEETAPSAPPPPFEEETAPSAPPPPFEEETAPSAPPPPFEEETAPSAPPPPFEEEPELEPPPAMEPAMEAPAPPVAPPEREFGEGAPSDEASTVEAPPEARKVLIAFPDPQMVNMLKFVLSGANFAVSSATDGVSAMVKALKELPTVVIADVRLSKIHGIEIMKRLSTREETKDIKVILTGSKPENEVPFIPGSSGYIQQDHMQQGLVDLVKKVFAEPAAKPASAEGPAEKHTAVAAKQAAPAADPGVLRAQRFARTVLSDIDLYNKDKVNQSVHEGNFESVFAKELQEGRKLYDMRIPADARNKGKFFEEAIKTFLEKKKRELGI